MQDPLPCYPPGYWSAFSWSTKFSRVVVAYSYFVLKCFGLGTYVIFSSRFHSERSWGMWYLSSVLTDQMFGNMGAGGGWCACLFLQDVRCGWFGCRSVAHMRSTGVSGLCRSRARVAGIGHRRCLPIRIGRCAGRCKPLCCPCRPVGALVTFSPSSLPVRTPGDRLALLQYCRVCSCPVTSKDRLANRCSDCGLVLVVELASVEEVRGGVLSERVRVRRMQVR